MKSYKSAVADIVEPTRVRQARSRLQPTKSDISIALSELGAGFRSSEELPRDKQLLLSFRGHNNTGFKISVIQHLKDDSFCSDAIILRRCPGDMIKVFSSNESVENIPYSTRAFPGVFEVLSKRVSFVLDKNITPWKALFYYKPKALILIPVNIYRYKLKKELLIECIVVLAYNDHIPEELNDEAILGGIIEFCNLTAPLLFNVQRFEDSHQRFKEIARVLDSIRLIEKEIQDVGSCINTIGLELQTLFRAAHSVVFLKLDDPYDAKLIKYCSFGGGTVHEDCPDRECHGMEELQQKTTYPAGWSALHRKCLRANDATELSPFCGSKNNNTIHTIGGCIVKNVMCFVIDDRSEDMSLVIEISDKMENFSDANESAALLFADRVCFILSASVLLDYRKRAVRRNDITNEVINNIKTVQFTKVQHLLDLKFNYSHSFRRKFLNFKFLMRNIENVHLPGIVLFMFTELEFINRWKMRRATLIRFILSIEQGYRNNPYHNWRHACTVTHFAFLLLKKLNLQKDGYLTDIESLAFFVSCLSHDIDHRGVNSRVVSLYQTVDNSNGFNLYTQEEGLVQRQHLAVTLQILSSDECNIVENMVDEEYQSFMELVQWNILSTDIGRHIQNRDTLFQSLEQFEKVSSADRKQLLSILMTVCDLCETVKTWNEYIITVRGIFAEFFFQGDEEVKLGYVPIPTMDRRVAYIPLIEMKFINDIVRPAYYALAELLPIMDVCLQTIDYFKELWLMATKIFEDFAHLHNPLEILELIEMKEDNLKTMAHPELHKHVYRIRKSLGSVSSLPRLSMSTLHSRSIDMSNYNYLSYAGASGVGISQTPKRCRCICLRKCWARLCSCCRCRRSGINDAAIIRRFNQESVFMEERSHIYERKRSTDSGQLNLLNKND